MSKTLILLSGGLDSYVALDLISRYSNVILALNFNYGQKAFSEENEASEKIAKLYNTELKTIELPYLKNICNNALTDESNKNLDKFDDVWIPNRNGLFINIAACFCDRYDIDNIAMGLNLEEARDFSDNSKEFVESANKFLQYSTQKQVKLTAPCANMTKIDIINYAIDNNLDLNIIKSCYDNIKNTSRKNCGKCMSCKLLYNAIINSNKPELVKELF